MKRRLRQLGGVAALLALAASAEAQNAPFEIELASPLIEASSDEPFSLTVSGEPGHLPVLVLGVRRGTSPLPGIGTIDIALAPAPMVMAFPPIPASGERVIQSGIGCGTPLVWDGPVYIQAVSFDPSVMDWDQVSNLVAFQVASGDCGLCAQEALADSFGTTSAGHALWLPGIATDLVFVAGGAFTERADGTAALMGVVESESDPSIRFAVDVVFSGRIDPMEPSHPPAGSPKRELASNAYSDNGGPVETANWHYYEDTEGILMGLGCLEGAVVSVSRRGPAFQVGLGANGKGVVPGGSGWLDWETLEQPVDCDPLQESGTGDINVDVCGECLECVEEAGDHAITLQLFGDDFLFVDGGTFDERHDGTAVLSGTVENDIDASNRWEVEIVFSDERMPLSAAYPPAGSPKKELGASSYVENGGVVDTSTWRYYLVTEGTLVGLDDNDGEVLEVSRIGPAFQIGVGANGKNEEYGASGWIEVEAASDGSTSKGDINVDLFECP